MAASVMAGSGKTLFLSLFRLFDTFLLEQAMFNPSCRSTAFRIPVRHPAFRSAGWTTPPRAVDLGGATRHILGQRNAARSDGALT